MPVLRECFSFICQRKVERSKSKRECASVWVRTGCVVTWCRGSRPPPPLHRSYPPGNGRPESPGTRPLPSGPALSFAAGTDPSTSELFSGEDTDRNVVAVHTPRPLNPVHTRSRSTQDSGSSSQVPSHGSLGLQLWKGVPGLWFHPLCNSGDCSEGEWRRTSCPGPSTLTQSVSVGSDLYRPSPPGLDHLYPHHPVGLPRDPPSVPLPRG